MVVWKHSELFGEPKVRAATKHLTPKHLTFIPSLGGPGGLDAPGGGFPGSNSSGKLLLVLQRKPPPEASKPPGPPKLAMKAICLGVICLVCGPYKLNELNPPYRVLLELYREVRSL